MANQLEIQLTSNGKIKENSVLVFLSDGKSPLYDETKWKSAANLPEVFFSKAANNPGQKIQGLTGEGSIAVALNTEQIKHRTDQEKIKILAANALRLAEKEKAEELVIPLEGASEAHISAAAEGLLIAGYKFTEYKSKQEDKAISITFVVASGKEDDSKKVLENARVINSGVSLARDLVNTPGGDAYPEVIAQKAVEIAEKHQLTAEILTKKELEEGNYNGILTVGRGSSREPRLIMLHYKPAKPSKVKLALVGKAVAFDTGGYCIKGAKGMWEMKGDMAGGAAVLGAMNVLAQLRPDIEISAYVPSVINAVGPDAYLPGDIIRSRSGQTVHVDNTDAEGRLILMDALDKAQEDGATHMIDLATLTGSVVAALGNALTGIFGADDELVDLISQAGSDVGEEYWRLPLVDEYRDELKHSVADMDNVGKYGKAGSIIAALFLQKFVKPETKWAHLDIAGTFLVNKEWKYFPEGATGVGVRTLVETVKRLQK